MRNRLVSKKLYISRYPANIARWDIHKICLIQDMNVQEFLQQISFSFYVGFLECLALFLHTGTKCCHTPRTKSTLTGSRFSTLEPSGWIRTVITLLSTREYSWGNTSCTPGYWLICHIWNDDNGIISIKRKWCGFFSVRRVSLESCLVLQWRNV